MSETCTDAGSGVRERKHTPGPWQALEEIVDLRPDSAEFGPEHEDWFDAPGQTFEEQCANARLIAAAPDLLAAAMELLTADAEVGHYTRRSESAFNALRAAIRKATAPTPETAKP